MHPNPYSTSEMQQDASLSQSRTKRPWCSRALFIFAAFLSAFGAFYGSLVFMVFDAPYMHEHISTKYFMRWLDWAFYFSVFCTAIVGALSFLTPRIRPKHFLFLAIPLIAEIAVTFYFFAAFFGI